MDHSEHSRNPARPAVPAPVDVHRPVPLAPSVIHPAAPLAPVQPDAVPALTSIMLPDGRVITGYSISPAQPEPLAAKPAVSRTAVNIALGGVGFAAVCGGLFVLTTFITALAALITQLVILAAVVFGGWVAVQVFGGHGGGKTDAGTTVNIRKAVFKRNHFHG
ncbi:MULTISPECIES: hypothetical protein [unclassified Streptomyces]|uniref:hypothetical protein n=1 Tax=unclassified Streptomyces TaxID=2593676 RepID=UPI000DDA440A|nr:MULTISPECIES: hypothetical protein [unclassified Streptomyces]QZZ28832.1 hypothetical protein A7X85_23540 [Streptomyces sp. ST1015]